MYESIKYILFVLLFIFLGCSPKQSDTQKIIVVKNNLGLARSSETVTISLADLNFYGKIPENNLLAKDLTDNVYRRVQFIDQNSDGIKDALIFQNNMPPHSKKEIELIDNKDNRTKIDSSIFAFSRFVPERVDDYAWENDCVAFRIYGPEAENLVKKEKIGGTLSSGIDCWLKRVNYPVIDKWYKMDAEGKGSYHFDHGEGLDSYHVGNSRGCGGIGVFSGDTLYVSNNFTSYQTQDRGPLRTSFILDYAPWIAGKETVVEKKHVSIDLGSNLTKIEIQFEPPYPEEIIAGLHIPQYNEGEIGIDEKAGWFSYWSKHNDSELGIGIVAEPKYVTGYKEYRVDRPEGSHLFVRLRPVDDKIVYYTGFGWKKSGRFGTIKDWNQYLSDFSKFLFSPIEVIKQ